ncbi:MAG: hypothetical protein JRN59_00160 [Nitrososphaerota archaeon]|nr:hypothetical protein [Nitrososphaerota archaeon]MDG6919925.1 hypothetical protein [Nitrososphaerota archaeon]
MRRLSYINWRETVRRGIEATIEAEELKNRNVDPRDIRAGVAIAASVRRKSGGWDST